MKKFLKIFAFVVCYAVLIYIVFIVEMMWQFLQLGTEISMESEFFGEFSYNAIYYGLPIIVFIIPFVFMVWKRDKWMEIIMCALITILSYALIICAISVSLNCYFKSFTLSKWEEYPQQRYLMTDDLAGKYEFAGMTTDEVKAFLGEPTSEGKNRLLYSPYALKYSAGNSLLGERIFNVSYDENNVVVSVDTYTDK